jgi:hypothetical protein
MAAIKPYDFYRQIIKEKRYRSDDGIVNQLDDHLFTGQLSRSEYDELINIIKEDIENAEPKDSKEQDH